MLGWLTAPPGWRLSHKAKRRRGLPSRADCGHRRWAGMTLLSPSGLQSAPTFSCEPFILVFGRFPPLSSKPKFPELKMKVDGLKLPVPHSPPHYLGEIMPIITPRLRIEQLQRLGRRWCMRPIQGVEGSSSGGERIIWFARRCSPVADTKFGSPVGVLS